MIRSERRLQSTRQKQAMTAPQKGGGCRRGGGGTAKERGRIDKGPPRRRQSGADGCPLSDEANCRTCRQRRQELYEKRKKNNRTATEPPHKGRPLGSSPPMERPPKRRKPRANKFCPWQPLPLKGGKAKGA